MSHTFTNLHYHCIFATKDRQPLLAGDRLDRVLGYMRGIVREIGGQSISLGGTADHVHLLVGLPPTLTVSDAMRLVKTNSSKWLRESFGDCSRFGWQTGYAAFTVSASGLAKVRGYIENQAEHHRTRTFDDEYRAFLTRHGFRGWEERVGSG